MVTPEEIVDAYLNANQALYRVNREMYQDIEAAKTIGLSRIQILYKILAPQILRHALPGLGNVRQVTLKDTALISVTGLVEIMRQSYIAAGSTRDPLLFYSTAFVLYLIFHQFHCRQQITQHIQNPLKLEA